MYLLLIKIYIFIITKAINNKANKSFKENHFLEKRAEYVTYREGLKD